MIFSIFNIIAVTLFTWTAPGDDGNVGQASHYDIRTAPDSMTLLQNWAQATTIESPFVPKPAGEKESLLVDIPSGNYLAVKTSDEAGNWSEISNLATGSTSAEDWQPCGPRSSCNSQTNQERIAGGGPLRNYDDNGTWRKINSVFRLVSGKLVSDSGFHAVEADLATNIVRLNWKGHILKQGIGPLFAYRRSTNTRTKLADPNFTNRSYNADTITIVNIYPNVDLKVINTPDDLRHKFVFHQAARTAFETWWQNNGTHDDIYIVNAIRLYVDSLGLSWQDDVGDFNLSQDKDITGWVKFKLGDATEFFMPDMTMEMPAVYEECPVYKRIALISGNPYLLEGFKWSQVRGCAAGDISHFSTFGMTTAATGYRTPGENAKYVAIYQMGVADGTLDSIYVWYKETYSGATDTIIGMIYKDSSIDGGSSNKPGGLLAISDSIFYPYPDSGWKGESISGTVLANQYYWLGGTLIGDGGDNITYLGYNGTATNAACYVASDPLPLSDPWGSSYTFYTYKLCAYAVYTVSGGAAVNNSQVIMIQQ